MRSSFSCQRSLFFLGIKRKRRGSEEPGSESRSATSQYLSFLSGKRPTEMKCIIWRKKAFPGQTFWAITLSGLEFSRGINYWQPSPEESAPSPWRVVLCCGEAADGRPEMPATANTPGTVTGQIAPHTFSPTWVTLSLREIMYYLIYASGEGDTVRAGNAAVPCWRDSQGRALTGHLPGWPGRARIPADRTGSVPPSIHVRKV